MTVFAWISTLDSDCPVAPVTPAERTIPLVPWVFSVVFPNMATLEIALAAKQPTTSAKDWRKVIGMFRDSDFMRQVDEECLRSREAERETARREEPGE